MPPTKRSRSYRAGSVRIQPVSRTRAVIDVHNPFGRKQLGFHTPDVVLSIRRPRAGERYEGKYQVEPEMGLPGEQRLLEKHALAHALHIRLHDAHRIPFKRHSILFQFSHEFWEMFERRGLYRAIQHTKRMPRNTFTLARKALAKDMDSFVWPRYLMRACVTHYPNRKAIMEGIERLYASPHMQPILKRLSVQMDVTPRNEPQTKKDLHAIIDFFANDTQRYMKKNPKKENKRRKEHASRTS